jgi:hypothetical protein
MTKGRLDYSVGDLVRDAQDIGNSLQSRINILAQDAQQYWTELRELVKTPEGENRLLRKVIFSIVAYSSISSCDPTVRLNCNNDTHTYQPETIEAPLEERTEPKTTAMILCGRDDCLDNLNDRPSSYTLEIGSTLIDQTGFGLIEDAPENE